MYISKTIPLNFKNLLNTIVIAKTNMLNWPISIVDNYIKIGAEHLKKIIEEAIKEQKGLIIYSNDEKLLELKLSEIIQHIKPSISIRVVDQYKKEEYKILYPNRNIYHQNNELLNPNIISKMYNRSFIIENVSDNKAKIFSITKIIYFGDCGVISGVIGLRASNKNIALEKLNEVLKEHVNNSSLVIEDIIEKITFKILNAIDIK